MSIASSIFLFAGLMAPKANPNSKGAVKFHDFAETTLIGLTMLAAACTAFVLHF